LGVTTDTVPAPDSGKELAPPELPPTLARELTARSVQAVGKLGTSLAPVDMQRARHLLALARQWGDSKDAQDARAMLHGAVCDGDLDSVARTVRRYNATQCMERALWADAVRPSGEYRTAPGVRIELLTRPRWGAVRTGYVLAPGAEFTSVREVVDADGNMWLRVGDARAIAADAFASNATRVEGGATVRREDFPHAVGARVRRGPDWQYDDEDGGEGSQGTMLGLYDGAEGWARVRWDRGHRPEDYHRVGGERAYDLIYVGAPPMAAPQPQGWVKMRPGGPATTPVVAPVRGSLRCYDCGGDLAQPFPSMRRSSRGIGSQVAFTPVNADDVRLGAIALVAATFERVEIVEVLKPPPKEKRAPEGDEAAAPPTEEETEAVQEVVDEAAGDAPAEEAAPEAPAAEDEVAEGPQPSLLLCRFQGDGASDGGDEYDEAVFRPDDLVWPASEIDKPSSTYEEFRSYQGIPRCRRELVLMLGSEETARAAWDEAGAGDAMTFASCVRGHLLHARCFQGRLLAGRGCPVCTEPLFVPRVQRTRVEGDDACCGAAAGDADVAAALGAAQEVEVAATQQAEGSPTGSGAAAAPDEVERHSGGRLQMKMCPVCCAGPLLNENCSDLRSHHGQCPMCGEYPHSGASIAEAMAKPGRKTVGERIPKCEKCNVAVTFNGCQECGHLFADIDWDELPKWDSSAKGCLEVANRHRRAARLLAAQVRHEAALLAHERAALQEARSGGEMYCPDCTPVEPPAPPPPLPPRCGRRCTRRHRGPCLICDRDAREHDGHMCPDGRRGSWLLLPGTIDESRRDYDEEEEEEEE